MNFIDYPIAFSVAILYTLFFHKLADVLTHRKDVYKECEQEDKKKQDYEEEMKCIKKIDKENLDSETKRFTILMASGLIALALSYYTKQPSIIVGLGLAGIMLVLTGTSKYWHRMTDKSKLAVIGIALVAITMIPVYGNKYKSAIFQ